MDGLSDYLRHIGHEEYLMTRRQYGGSSIMIWARFSEKEVANIAF